MQQAKEDSKWDFAENSSFNNFENEEYCVWEIPVIKADLSGENLFVPQKDFEI